MLQAPLVQSIKIHFDDDIDFLAMLEYCFMYSSPYLIPKNFKIMKYSVMLISKSFVQQSQHPLWHTELGELSKSF